MLQVHVNSKPPFSFSCLIFMAIEDSVDKALPVKDIYIWILNHFPYYRNAPTGWKNSVRHNLSLNKCFKKVDKSPVRVSRLIMCAEIRFYNLSHFAEFGQRIAMDGRATFPTMFDSSSTENALPSVS